MRREESSPREGDTKKWRGLGRKGDEGGSVGREEGVEGKEGKG